MLPVHRSATFGGRDQRDFFVGIQPLQPPKAQRHGMFSHVLCVLLSCRQGLYITLDKWKTAIFRIGFLIEGRSEEELPEHILGCAVLKGMNKKQQKMIVYFR